MNIDVVTEVIYSPELVLSFTGKHVVNKQDFDLVTKEKKQVKKEMK